MCGSARSRNASCRQSWPRAPTRLNPTFGSLKRDLIERVYIPKRTPCPKLRRSSKSCQAADNLKSHPLGLGFGVFRVLLACVSSRSYKHTWPSQTARWGRGIGTFIVGDFLAQICVGHRRDFAKTMRLAAIVPHSESPKSSTRTSTGTL